MRSRTNSRSELATCGRESDIATHSGYIFAVRTRSIMGSTLQPEDRAKRTAPTRKEFPPSLPSAVLRSLWTNPDRLGNAFPCASLLPAVSPAGLVRKPPSCTVLGLPWRRVEL